MSKWAARLGHASNCASVACAIHCLVFPVFIGILPVIGLSPYCGGTIERSIVLTAVIFSLISLCWGYKTHRSIRCFAFFVAGSMWFYEATQVRQHLLFSLVGGGCLITANITNRLLCKTCKSCNCVQQ